jgi:hypothetical protein
MKKSVLDELRKFQKQITESDNFGSHFMVGVDLTEDGAPSSSMMISKGKPFETIGMIDILIQNLKDTRSDIVKKLSQKENKKEQKTSQKLSKKADMLIDMLPDELQQRIKDLKAKLYKALEEGDLKALMQAKAELNSLREEFKPGGDSDDSDDDFNLDDFKGNIS